jgi:hypothetical protein
MIRSLNSWPFRQKESKTSQLNVKPSYAQLPVNPSPALLGVSYWRPARISGKIHIFNQIY